MLIVLDHEQCMDRTAATAQTAKRTVHIRVERRPERTDRSALVAPVDLFGHKATQPVADHNIKWLAGGDQACSQFRQPRAGMFA